MIQEARGEVVAATRLRLKHCLHMPLRQGTHRSSTAHRIFLHIAVPEYHGVNILWCPMLQTFPHGSELSITQ